METSCGPIALDRADGTLATLSIEGQPDRAVALKRRDTSELIAEELRRLDPDDTYASALRYGVDRLNGATAEAVEEEPATAKAAAKTAAAKTPAKKAPAKVPAKKAASE
jgi:glucose-6-phosphate dehydrogenase assembly protein OpcA